MKVTEINRRHCFCLKTLHIIGFLLLTFTNLNCAMMSEYCLLRLTGFPCDTVLSTLSKAGVKLHNIVGATLLPSSTTSLFFLSKAEITVCCSNNLTPA